MSKKVPTEKYLSCLFILISRLRTEAGDLEKGIVNYDASSTENLNFNNLLEVKPWLYGTCLVETDLLSDQVVDKARDKVTVNTANGL